MKKKKITFISLFTILILSGCSGISDTNTSDKSAKTESIFLESAEITIPAGLAGNELSDYSPSANNVDGTITYLLSGNERTDIINKLSDEIAESIQKILDDNDYYPNVESITHDDSYTAFTISLKDGQMNIYESMLVMSFYTAGDKYQIYSGTPLSEAVTTVIYKNSSTGENINQSDSTSMNTFESSPSN